MKPISIRQRIRIAASILFSRQSAKDSYDAARTGRRLGGWRPGMTGPNVVLRDLNELRNRARDLARNNPWITRGINSWVANEIGCGITFKAATPDTAFNAAADELWEEQCEHFDADGMQDFAGMLATIVRTRRTAGEIFVRRRFRRLSDGLPVPLQYQLLEPEFCPHEHTTIAPQAGRVYRAGIEFDAIGRRRSYRMYRNHPGDHFVLDRFAAGDLFDIPASEIYHHYDPFRPGQIRGVPAIVQAMVKARDFDEYDDAELVRKKTRATFTGMITRPKYDGDDEISPFTGLPREIDEKGIVMDDVEPGSFLTGLPGEEVEMFEGDNTGSGYEEFVRQQLLGIGAGQDVPYEFISGDFSKLNDRTLRVVLAEYHRCVEQDRWRLTIPQICYPIWRDFIETAIVAGALREPLGLEPRQYLKVACHPEGWPYLHELQDANAAIARRNAGLTSRKRLAAERGEDIREIDAENAEDLAREKELGLKYESAQNEAEPEPERRGDA